MKIKMLPRAAPSESREEKGEKVVVSPTKHRLGEMCYVSISGMKEDRKDN